MQPKSIFVVVLSFPVVATGCDGGATRSQMRDAVVEVAALEEGLGAQADLVEVTTSFTIGQGIEAIREEIRAFVTSQIPCSTVTLESNTVTIDFGGLADACVYRGRTFAGVVSVAIDSAPDGVLVTHTYSGFTTGKATLDGTAAVLWNGNRADVTTELHVATSRGEIDLESERTHTISACEGADAVCFTADGYRSWSGPRGEWDLTIAGIRARSIDPVPEEGRYSLLTPEEKTIEMSFDRVDTDTIQVTLESGRHTFDVRVNSAGQVED
jgi:hypothetical protein